MNVREQAGPAGLTVLRVMAGALELAFLPALGGRLWSMRIDGAELLWRDEQAWQVPAGTWINAGGSKTWPAPQGAWGGPPGAIDSDPFGVAVEQDDSGVQVSLTSAADPTTGILVERRFDIPRDGSGFAQSTTFLNTGDHSVTWSIWEVCQLDLRAGARIEIESDDEAPVALGDSVPAVRDGRSWIVSPHGAHGKIGFPGASGSARFVRDDGVGFGWRFDPEPGRPHPDRNSRVTVYATGEPGRGSPTAYAELEVMSALLTLEPGERMVRRLEWTVQPLR